MQNLFRHYSQQRLADIVATKSLLGQRNSKILHTEKVEAIKSDVYSKIVEIRDSKIETKKEQTRAELMRKFTSIIMNRHAKVALNKWRLVTWSVDGDPRVGLILKEHREKIN
jgi:hypothetical protein